MMRAAVTLARTRKRWALGRGLPRGCSAGWPTTIATTGSNPAGHSELFRNARAVKPRQRSADPTRTERARVRRQHEVLRSPAAVEGRFRIPRLSAKEHQRGCVPEDLEVRTLGPRPRTPVQADDCGHTPWRERHSSQGARRPLPRTAPTASCRLPAEWEPARRRTTALPSALDRPHRGGTYGSTVGSESLRIHPPPPPLRHASLPPHSNRYRPSTQRRRAAAGTARLAQAVTSHSSSRSARKRVAFESVRPSALAVFMLITNSNLVGRSIGISPGLAPLRILSTKKGARR